MIEEERLCWQGHRLLIEEEDAMDAF